MKIDPGTAGLVAEAFELIRRAKENANTGNNKPLKEFIYFYVECKFYNKQALKREYAADRGISESELEYHHPVPHERIIAELMALPVVTQEDVVTCFGKLPSPIVMTREEHRRVHGKG